MKCPKCGFNSFEFLESCKKCGAGFGSFKQTHGISPVILRSGSALAAAAVPGFTPRALLRQHRRVRRKKKPGFPGALRKNRRELHAT